MKRILTILAVSLALAQASRGQILTVNSGFTVQPLFTETPGYDISAMGADSSGNLYYLDTVKIGSNFVTELLKRTAASGYSTPSILYTYSGSVYGDFVKVSGSTVYFGESTNNTIRSISVNGDTATLIATLPYNYDMAFDGSMAFVDASDANYLNNTVSMLNLTTGALTPVLKTNGASGPIAFNSSGSLFYGASTYGDPGGIYAFSATQVANALTGTPLTLSSATPLLNAGEPNQYLAFKNDTSLYQANSSGTTNLLQLFNPANPSAAPVDVGQIDTADEGDVFDGVVPIGNSVLVGVSSQYGTQGATNSEVFLVTPEPGSAALLAIGGVWMLGRRRFRAKRCA
jgi:hypothetical protein